MADFATWQDVQARWRPLTSAEQGVATTLLSDVSDMIRSRFPDVDARIANGSLTAASVKRVAAAAVKRAMIGSDAEGLEARAQTAGPFSVSDKFANPNGNLYLTAEDIRLLGGEYSAASAKVGWLA